MCESESKILILQRFVSAWDFDLSYLGIDDSLLHCIVLQICLNQFIKYIIYETLCVYMHIYMYRYALLVCLMGSLKNAMLRIMQDSSHLQIPAI